MISNQKIAELYKNENSGPSGSKASAGSRTLTAPRAESSEIKKRLARARRRHAGLRQSYIFKLSNSMLDHHLFLIDQHVALVASLRDESSRLSYSADEAVFRQDMRLCRHPSGMPVRGYPFMATRANCQLRSSVLKTSSK